MALIGELLEDISRNAPAIQARKLLVEHYISVGWLDAARDNVKELQKHAPRDGDVTAWANLLSKKPVPEEESSPKDEQTTKKKHATPHVKLPANLEHAKGDLTHGYKNLQRKAKSLLTDLLHLQHLQKKQGYPASNNVSKLKAITEGETVEVRPPGSARSVAKKVQEEPGNAFNIIIADLEDMMKWLRSPRGKHEGADNDTVREALVKRVQSLESALTGNHKLYPEVALMHIEHESLGKTYVNEETMLGDTIAEISRDNFWVTEDNYAWDMEELAQAITANGGIMRNPLSRQMFTTKDIRGIVSHPAGKKLAALQVEQHELSKGIRAETITQMEKLGKVLLDDQTSDALPSRHAVDEFLAYCATCESSSSPFHKSLKVS